mmetsp:Transcript_14155/g.18538  ORF Transcript_14155/g.18538 Transcript_14155/m.18538 type:complete len:493 (+) Transcript_14155:31-1509(+)
MAKVQARAVDKQISSASNQDEIEIEPLNNIVLKSMKRTFDMFIGSVGKPIPEFVPSQKIKIACKLNTEYEIIKAQQEKQKMNDPETGKSDEDGKKGNSQVHEILKSIAEEQKEKTRQQISNALITTNQGPDFEFKPPEQTATGAIVTRKKATKVPIPEWHAPWKLQAVISGHLGWVRAISFDPSNEWFATGSADRTIKIWDLAKCTAGVEGGLKLTLTGHINCVRGLAVSPRHPYLFSAGEDKKVMCWDLEYNKVIRHYHGHLSGVYSLALHPTLDLLVTGGRDSVARVWDIRTKTQVHVLSGHQNTIGAIATNAIDPQVITGGHDCAVKLWDLAAGKVMTTLTHHKKAVRDVKMNPKEFSFVSAAADNIKKWQARDGVFLKNLSGHNTIINCMAVNEDGVLVSGGDNGSICFWDYSSGYSFQRIESVVQPGSLDCEAGIFALTYDVTGSRLISCEADKTIKIWKEDSEATEDSHPIDMKTWTKQCLAPRRR